MAYITSPYLQYLSRQENCCRVFNHLNGNIHDINVLTILDYCQEPREVQHLIERFDTMDITALIRLKILLDEKTVWQMNCATHIEIETSTICNWKCEYCPVRYHLRPAKYINLDIFSKIVDRAVEYRHIKDLTLHAYNEPTIDPNFYTYLDIIGETDLKLSLYTNGSGLDFQKIEFLKNYKNLKNIVVTFPSINENKFRDMTGSNDYAKTLSAIEELLRQDMNVYLAVQGKGEELKKELEQIRCYFGDIGMTVHDSFDRAGLLENKYHQNLYYRRNHLRGCRTLMDSVSVNVDGNVYLCCNDFFQKYQYGNLLHDSIQNVLKNLEMTRLRKIIWGADPADSDFICRRCCLMQYQMVLKKYDRFHETDTRRPE